MRLRYLLGTLYLAFLGSYLDPAMILPTALAMGYRIWYYRYYTRQESEMKESMVEIGLIGFGVWYLFYIIATYNSMNII